MIKIDQKGNTEDVDQEKCKTVTGAPMKWMLSGVWLDRKWCVVR